MKIDYNAVEELMQELNKELILTDEIINSINEDFKKASSIENWNSKTGEYFRDKIKIIQENSNANYNLQKSIINYLSTTLSNYKVTENKAINAFNSFGDEQ